MSLTRLCHRFEKRCQVWQSEPQAGSVPIPSSEGCPQGEVGLTRISQKISGLD